MPIYEYRCETCSKTHEVMQKFSDLPMSACPDCLQPVTKLMSLSAFSLKGTGWYVTDYKGKSSPPTSDAAAPGKEATAPKDGTSGVANASASSTTSSSSASSSASADSAKAPKSEAASSLKPSPSPSPNSKPNSSPSPSK